MRTLRVIFVLSALHLATGSSLLAQSSQRADWLSLSDNVSVKLLPDTISSVSNQPSSSTSVLPATFKFHQKKNTILLYLRNSDNQVSLRVIDSTGNIVQVAEQKNLDQGFYEYVLFKKPAHSSIYTACLVVNEQMLTFQIFP